MKPYPNEELERMSKREIIRLYKRTVEQFNDSVPVIHGKWVDETFEPWGLVHHPYKCNLCGEHAEFASPYCPNCGARMDEERDSDPNGFNDETVQALKDTMEQKNLSKVYETLDDMYEDNVDRMTEVWREDDE